MANNFRSALNLVRSQNSMDGVCSDLVGNNMDMTDINGGDQFLTDSDNTTVYAIKCKICHKIVSKGTLQTVILKNKNKYYMMDNDWNLLHSAGNRLNVNYLKDIEMCVTEKNCVNDHMCGYFVVMAEEKRYNKQLLFQSSSVYLSTDFFHLT